MADTGNEADRRIAQMVAFIRQEARDKAEEIEVRAKEEANVEVLKMTDREKTKCRTEFAAKTKRVEIEKKIARQQLLDQYRMDLLKQQDQKKQQLHEMCLAEFSKVTSGAQYKAFMKDAIVQAMFKIWDEDTVEVSCRKEDAGLVQGLIKDALKEVKTRAKNECNEELKMQATFNKQAANISGGVIVTARGGRIVCDNSLEARLGIVMKKELPVVRSRLFTQERLVSTVA